MSRWWIDRLSVRSVLAALPLFGLAVVFAFGLLPREDLERVITYELLLIHAFPFMMAPALATPRTLRGKLARVVFFWGLLAGYLATAYRVDGWVGILTLGLLGLFSYAGLFFSRLECPAGQQIGRRWLIALLLLFFVAIARVLWIMVFGGTPGYTQDPGFGMLFFAALGVFELFDLYVAMGQHDQRSDQRTRRSGNLT